jgi:hypothetical protein
MAMGKAIRRSLPASSFTIKSFFLAPFPHSLSFRNFLVGFVAGRAKRTLKNLGEDKIGPRPQLSH